MNVDEEDVEVAEEADISLMLNAMESIFQDKLLAQFLFKPTLILLICRYVLLTDVNFLITHFSSYLIGIYRK